MPTPPPCPAPWSVHPARLRLLAAVFLAAAAAGPSPASAFLFGEEPTVEEKKAAANKMFLVQLLPLMAPVNDPHKPGAMLPVTPFISVKTEPEVTAVCNAGATIRDILVTTLYERPVPLKDDGVPNLDVVAKPLLDMMRSSVPAASLIELRLVEGAKMLGKGVLNLLPYATIIGCAAKETEKKKEGGGGH